MKPRACLDCGAEVVARFKRRCPKHDVRQSWVPAYARDHAKRHRQALKGAATNARRRQQRAAEAAGGVTLRRYRREALKTERARPFMLPPVVDALDHARGELAALIVEQHYDARSDFTKRGPELCEAILAESRRYA